MARKKDVVEQEGLKFCPRCGVVKSKDAFSRQPSRPDGLAPFCEPCRLEYEAEYREKRKQEKQQMLGEIMEGYEYTCMICGHEGTEDSLKLYGPDVKNSLVFYRKLKAKGFPSSYGLRCLNCEAEKREAP